MSMDLSESGRRGAATLVASRFEGVVNRDDLFFQLAVDLQLEVWNQAIQIRTLQSQLDAVEHQREQWREAKRRSRAGLRNDPRQTSLYGEGHTRELSGDSV